MGSPAYFGKLAALEAMLRKPALIPVGLFSPQDDLSFIPDMPGLQPSFTPTTTAPDGIRTTFLFAGLPAYIVWNGVDQFLGVGYTITGPISGIYTVTLIDYQGNVLTPGSTDDIRAASTNIVPVANISGQLSQASVAYSATLVINVTLANVITVLLTGNVTSTVFSYPFSAPPVGTWLYVRFQQDGTGGWTVILPTNLVTDVGFEVDPGAGRITVLPVEWDGSAWVFLGSPFSVAGA